MLVSPAHNGFVEDAIAVVRFDLPEFYRLHARDNGLRILAFERQSQSVQGFRTGAVRIFSVEFCGSLRGDSA